MEEASLAQLPWFLYALTSFSHNFRSKERQATGLTRLIQIITSRRLEVIIKTLRRSMMTRSMNSKVQIKIKNEQIIALAGPI